MLLPLLFHLSESLLIPFDITLQDSNLGLVVPTISEQHRNKDDRYKSQNRQEYECESHLYITFPVSTVSQSDLINPNVLLFPLLVQYRLAKLTDNVFYHPLMRAAWLALAWGCAT